jgi:hypothetical protein
MSLLLPLSVDVNHDITWNFGVTIDGAALDLTPYTVKTLIKASATTDDSKALHTYSSPSSGVMVTNAPQGLVSWTVPNADVPVAGIFWYRLDIVAGLLKYDVFYGPLTVQAA